MADISFLGAGDSAQPGTIPSQSSVVGQILQIDAMKALCQIDADFSAGCTTNIALQIEFL